MLIRELFESRRSVKRRDRFDLDKHLEESILEEYDSADILPNGYVNLFYIVTVPYKISINTLVSYKYGILGRTFKDRKIPSDIKTYAKYLDEPYLLLFKVDPNRILFENEITDEVVEYAKDKISKRYNADLKKLGIDIYNSEFNSNTFAVTLLDLADQLGKSKTPKLRMDSQYRLKTLYYMLNDLGFTSLMVTNDNTLKKLEFYAGESSVLTVPSPKDLVWTKTINLSNFRKKSDKDNFPKYRINSQSQLDAKALATHRIYRTIDRLRPDLKLHYLRKWPDLVTKLSHITEQEFITVLEKDPRLIYSIKFRIPLSVINHFILYKNHHVLKTIMQYFIVNRKDNKDFMKVMKFFAERAPEYFRDGDLYSMPLEILNIAIERAKKTGKVDTAERIERVLKYRL